MVIKIAVVEVYSIYILSGKYLTGVEVVASFLTEKSVRTRYRMQKFPQSRLSTGYEAREGAKSYAIISQKASY